MSAQLFKIPPTYAAFVENFPVIEYLPAEAIDLKAGKQTDGGWVIYVELCQYIRANIESVLNYVPSDLGAKIQFIMDNFNPTSFPIISLEEAQANLLIVNLPGNE